ncbi:MAG: T9SS type A sorting domain-containing protein, partial [Bacteroidales bacterium]|nr:T9SS type A sorting domain-containing protein [Bacteroidales bacterium]
DDGIDGSTFDPTGLDLGYYIAIYTIVDGSCTAQDTVDILVGNNPILDTIVTDASTATATDGSIDLIVEGGYGTISYVWSNGETTEDLDELPVGIYSVTVTDQAGCSSVLDNIEIDFVNGISTNEIAINIYPNPASDKVFVNLMNINASQIDIVNSLGQVIISSEIESNNFEVNVSDFEQGVYFIQLHYNDKVFTQKLLID